MSALDEALARANEAARLSAAALDQADDLRREMGKLLEHVEIVERDRLDRDAWAVNVVFENRLECAAGDEYQVIARYLRELTAERDRLGEQCQHLVNRTGEFRAELESARNDAEIRRIQRDAAAGEMQAVREERDEARAEVVRLGKELDITIADAQHYRHLYEQLTARVEEVRQSGIEAAEREP